MSLNYFIAGENFKAVRAVIEDVPMKTVCRVAPDGLLCGRECRLSGRVSEYQGIVLLLPLVGQHPGIFGLSLLFVVLPVPFCK